MSELKTGVRDAVEECKESIRSIMDSCYKKVKRLPLSIRVELVHLSEMQHAYDQWVPSNIEFTTFSEEATKFVADEQMLLLGVFNRLQERTDLAVRTVDISYIVLQNPDDFLITQMNLELLI